MNLVVQGDAPPSPATLQRLAERTRARAIETIDAHAARILGAERDAAAQSAVAALCDAAALDWAWLPAGRRLADFGLFVTDMDSTLINIECIDEIADMRGLKTEVAAITDAAMRGEIDFRASLTRRVALLAGLPEQALAKVHAKRIRLNPGARALMARLKAAGVRTALVSGGFTYFTDRIRRELGFDHAWANELEIRDGRLTGQVLGAIVDGRAKAEYLTATRDALGLAPESVLCAGDGANDIPMFRAAGFSVAYRAKPALREVADCCLDHAGLDGIARLFAPPEDSGQPDMRRDAPVALRSSVP
ncbi:MAG: phosphoserine phosphatase SerB [Azoarcus sp.]|jgi:phosphoserine phosphatase|nr:phosphoserine phosphatase SerB [Azoarcus sp.]